MDLDSGAVVGHDYVGHDATSLSSQGHSLGMVATAVSHHDWPFTVGRSSTQLVNGICGSSNLSVEGREGEGVA